MSILKENVALALVVLICAAIPFTAWLRPSDMDRWLPAPPLTLTPLPFLVDCWGPLRTADQVREAFNSSNVVYVHAVHGTSRDKFLAEFPWRTYRCHSVFDEPVHAVRDFTIRSGGYPFLADFHFRYGHLGDHIILLDCPQTEKFLSLFRGWEGKVLVVGFPLPAQGPAIRLPHYLPPNQSDWQQVIRWRQGTDLTLTQEHLITLAATVDLARWSQYRTFLLPKRLYHDEPLPLHLEEDWFVWEWMADRALPIGDRELWQSLFQQKWKGIRCSDLPGWFIRRAFDSFDQYNSSCAFQSDFFKHS